jgi:hypothetical protein
VAAAAQGSALTTLAYLIVMFPVSLGIATALNDDGFSPPLEAFLQGLLLGYAVAFLWFLWLVCLVVAAVVGFPLAILIERGLRAAAAERWRPLAMGALGGLIGTVIVVVALVTKITGAEIDSVWPWVVIVIPGAVASAGGHWLATVLRGRSAARRHEGADDDLGA